MGLRPQRGPRLWLGESSADRTAHAGSARRTGQTLSFMPRNPQLPCYGSPKRVNTFGHIYIGDCELL
jgi:hypothetical protein